MKGAAYFSRASWAGPEDTLVRAPELSALRTKGVAVFGLGCLGAPSALELARAGVGEIRLLDHDFVDPATVGRWPLGVSAAGLLKAEVLTQFIKLNYPSTQVTPIIHRLGAVREPGGGAPSDFDVVAKAASGVSVIYDATAEIGVQHYLSDTARELGIPYVGVAGMSGGWGGTIVCVVPSRTAGCWMCYRHALNDGTIPEPASDPKGHVQARGCGDVTFTGAGFDMATIALAGVRTAVSVLCDGAEGGYPSAAWDVLTVALRDSDGNQIAPRFQQYTLARHADCACHAA